ERRDYCEWKADRSAVPLYACRVPAGARAFATKRRGRAQWPGGRAIRVRQPPIASRRPDRDRPDRRGGMSVALPVRTRRLGSHLEPVIRRAADAPSAAQRIIEKLVELMLNVELRIDPREITHRVCGLAGLGRIIRITHAASEADVLAPLRFEKDPGVPLLRIAEC